MITTQEIATALTGALRLAKADPSGLGFFEDTVEAFWRSFFAALIVAPGYAIMALLRLAAAPPTAGGFAVLVIEVIGYVIGWVAFPLAAYYLCNGLRRGERYIRYIVAYNWAQVLQVGLILAVLGFAASGLVPAGLAPVFDLAAKIAILIYQWYIARAALAVTGMTAAAFVFVDFLLGIVVLAAVTGLEGVQIPTSARSA